MKRLFAISIIAVALGTAAPAHADHLDDVSYLQVLNQYGIQYGDFSNADDALVIGKAACQNMSTYGYSPVSEATALADLHFITMEDAQYVVGAAIGAFCPEQKGNI
ncbi:MAG: hypothetical protein JWR34_1792 [Mycobacterium sp.]|nr:hypothetical protein [Mycobacterium sp.]